MSNAKIVKLIREYHEVSNERLGLDRQSAKLKVREDSILDELTTMNVESGKYGPYHMVVGTKQVPRCTDWSNFHAWIKATDSFDCLYKRLTESAVKARLEAGEYVPGIVVDEKKVYKFTVA